MSYNNLISNKIHIFKGNLYKIRLDYLISFKWFFWKINHKSLINEICAILDNWNKEIPSCSSRYPNFNRMNFLSHYKYWIHWVTKMDVREKIIFNEFNPYLLINEEEFIHLDLRNKEIPIMYYTYYFPTNEWKGITIFNSIDHLKNYLCINEASNETLKEYVDHCVRSARLEISKTRMKQGQSQSKLIIDDDGIRLDPNFINKS